MSRERILARRAHFVAIALAACGGSKARETVMVVGTSVPAASASAAPEPDAGDPDSDGDGIPDRLDYCPKEPGSGRGCPCLSIVQPYVIQIRETVQFASSQTALSPSAMPILDAVVSAIANNPAIRIRVEGHGDNQEQPSTSAARAKAVYDYLVSKGVAPKQLDRMAYGMTKPLVPNTTAENRAKNRRVGFTIIEPP